MVIGDFHGKFPKKFEGLIKKEKIDLIVSLGDLAPFHYRKLWFKHCYGKDVELWKIIGKKKYKEIVMKDLKMAERVLKSLNELNVPIYTVLGNIDWPSPDDVSDFSEKEKSMPNWDKKDTIAKRLKKYKNIHRFDYKALKFDDYVFVGMRGHSSPGDVKSKAFRKHKKILEKLFRKYKKENKKEKLIFVSHIVPYNTKLDKLGRHAHKKVRGKHHGSKLAKKIITEFHPVLALAGHVHENVGQIKIGRTTLVNPGAANEGLAALIDLETRRVRFLK